MPGDVLVAFYAGAARAWNAMASEEGIEVARAHAERVIGGETAGHWCNCFPEQREAARRFLDAHPQGDLLMDNFCFHVTAQGDDSFVTTLQLAIKLAGHNKVTHYGVDPKLGLALFWSEPKDGRLPKSAVVQPLPYPMDKDALTAFVAGWLRTADYGPQPDHDGENGRGWTIYTDDSWGHVWGSFYGVIAVKPAWAMYGK